MIHVAITCMWFIMIKYNLLTSNHFDFLFENDQPNANFGKARFFPIHIMKVSVGSFNYSFMFLNLDGGEW